MITSKERSGLREKLKKIEKSSGKKAKKWTRTKRRQRENYIKQIIKDKTFISHIYYSYYKDTKSYFDLTILSTAKAIHDKTKGYFETTVFVDGLKKTEYFRFGAGLRKLKIVVRKVRGIKDETDEFIRLADAVAGFVRDSLENDKTMRDLHKEAEEKEIIKKV